MMCGSVLFQNKKSNKGENPISCEPVWHGPGWHANGPFFGKLGRSNALQGLAAALLYPHQDRLAPLHLNAHHSSPTAVARVPGTNDRSR